MATTPQIDPMTASPKPVTTRGLQQQRPFAIWGKVAMCAALWLPLLGWGQASLPPWVSAMPGLEHPAAWAMQDSPIQVGLQQDARWNGNADPLTGLWFGAGWRPERKGRYNRMGADPLSFGVAFNEDPLSTGWRERSFSIATAASAPLNRELKAHAGLSIGATSWRLDPALWSWNAQYGQGGFDPQAPTGEALSDAANGGSRIDVAVSVGVAPTGVARQNGRTTFYGAVTLHHLSNGKSPHLSPVPNDSVRWRPAWWVEGQGDMGWEKLEWRAWNRGALQAQSHLLELGVAIGRSFGTSARFTKNQLSHHIETGLLWRSNGILRLMLGWERNGLRLNTGPSWSVGPIWRPSAGWSAGLFWAPDLQGSFALQR